MGRPPAFVRKLEALVREKLSEGCKVRYCRELKRINMENHQHLMAAGMETHPDRIGPPEVNHLRGCYPTNRGNYRNQQQHIQYLGIFLNWCGNPVLSDMKIRWPQGVNPMTDWLSPEELEMVWRAVGDDPELAMLFHLEGNMGLRRCEVERLTLQDIEPEYIRVLGKGRGDGKPRKVRKHPEWDAVFSDYMEYRDGIIRAALARNHLRVIPDGLMVYHHMGRLGTCKRTALDGMIARMRVISGIHFGHHTLRRTFGREMWKAGVPIETIASLLGHSDIRTTIRYLGVNLDDQTEAMRRLYARQREIRAGVDVRTSISTNLHQIA